MGLRNRTRGSHTWDCKQQLTVEGHSDSPLHHSKGPSLRVPACPVWTPLREGSAQQRGQIIQTGTEAHNTGLHTPILLASSLTLAYSGLSAIARLQSAMASVRLPVA